MKITQSFFLLALLFQFLPMVSQADGYMEDREWLEGVRIEKKYLPQGEFMVSEKGIYVLIDGLPLAASSLNADSQGIFVFLAKEDSKWNCPRCGRENDRPGLCSECKWPLYDDTGWLPNR